MQFSAQIQNTAPEPAAVKKTTTTPTKTNTVIFSPNPPFKF